MMETPHAPGQPSHAPPRLEALTRVLRQALGDEGVRTDATDLAYYGADRCRGSWTTAPGIIALPRTVEQVQDVVRACVAERVAIVPSGGRTGLAGAATATRGEVVLSLERMNRVLDVDVPGRLLRCQGGVTVEAVQQAAEAVGLMYPVDFAAKGSAHIAGSIATNAGGVRVLRYGTTRAWVSGLTVVTAQGDLLQTGRPLVKDNTGYDLRQLFIGSEGTLGMIVEATVRLCKPPRGTIVALCGLANDTAVLRLFERLQGEMVLQAFECFDGDCLQAVIEHRGRQGGPFATQYPQHVLVEVEVEGRGEQAFDETFEALTEVLGQAQDVGEIEDAVVAGSGGEAKELWALREDISESLHRHRPHKADIAVPVSRGMEFAARWKELVAARLPGARALVFGHVGDGNLHLNLLPPPELPFEAFLEACHALDEETYALIESFSGSISAEHGVGLLKRAHLHRSRSPEEVAAMRAIKSALDPDSLFNPGKIWS